MATTPTQCNQCNSAPRRGFIMRIRIRYIYIYKHVMPTKENKKLKSNRILSKISIDQLRKFYHLLILTFC